MKIRNIVFSGFMASILMAGAASAADAPMLATKGYVDSAYKSAVVGTTSELGKEITRATGVEGALKDLTTTSTANLVAAINSVKTDVTNEATAARAAEKANADDIAAINNTSTGILAQAQGYTDELANGAVKANTDAIEILNGEATTPGSVAYQIADAIDDVNTTTGTLTGDVSDLKSRMTTAENGILANTTAISDEETRAEEVEANLQSAIDAINSETNGILAQAQTYTNDEISDEVTRADNTYATKTDLSATNTNVTNNADAIAALQSATTCGDAVGDLCYIDHGGNAVKINTISSFDATQLN